MRTLQANAVAAVALSALLGVSTALPAFAKPPGGQQKAASATPGSGGANPDSRGNGKCPEDNGKAQHSVIKSQGNACGQFGNTGQPPGTTLTP
jgi:hypothetical protein